MLLLARDRGADLFEMFSLSPVWWSSNLSEKYQLLSSIVQVWEIEMVTSEESKLYCFSTLEISQNMS